jgi:hypothetical protein
MRMRRRGYKNDTNNKYELPDLTQPLKTPLEKIVHDWNGFYEDKDVKMKQKTYNTVFFSALGLKSGIPRDATYTDLGVVHDPYDAYEHALSFYNKEISVQRKDVAGLKFTIQSNEKTHHFIAYKQTDPVYTKLTRIHEEVHALFDLRPEHLERYLRDVYRVNIQASLAFINEHREIYYPDLDAVEKELYSPSSIDEELIPRIVENAYLDKHQIAYENDRPLFQEAKRLYEKFKR